MKFKQIVNSFYQEQGRIFSWRNDITPYKILVSEIMLQQTQTSRIELRLPIFLATFPTLQSLAGATTKEVLTAWQGLGYNRRGLYLHQTAKILVNEYNSEIPDDPATLKKLPGIGEYTSNSIVTFAYNLPTVFIETNIRAVYLYHYFNSQQNISDSQILLLIEQDLDYQNPRDWYYALMDYGVYLKSKHGSFNQQSKHYRKQSKFEGSNRQVRSTILKLLLQKPQNLDELQAQFISSENRIEINIKSLIKEGLIIAMNDKYTII